MKFTLPIILLIIGFSIMGIVAFNGVKSYYDFKTNYKSYWELADRSSTLQAKEQYIFQFVDLIKQNRNKFADYNAVIFKTPENNFDNNLMALQTLMQRLKDIKGMNETDFAYQIAIQQITEQEQGEAQNMLKDIEGSYYLHNYPIIWGWYLFIISFISVAFIFGGIIWIAVIYNKNKEEDYYG